MKSRKKVLKRAGSSILSVVLAITMLFSGGAFHIAPVTTDVAAAESTMELPVVFYDHLSDNLLFQYLLDGGPAGELDLMKPTDGKGLVATELGPNGTPVYTKETVAKAAERVKTALEYCGNRKNDAGFTDLYKQLFRQIVDEGAETVVLGGAVPTYDEYGWSFAKGNSKTANNAITVKDGDGDVIVSQEGDNWKFAGGTDNVATYDFGTLSAGRYTLWIFDIKNMVAELQGVDGVTINGDATGTYTFTLNEATPVKFVIHPKNDNEASICHPGLFDGEGITTPSVKRVGDVDTSLGNLTLIGLAETDLETLGWKTVSGTPISQTTWKKYGADGITCNAVIVDERGNDGQVISQHTVMEDETIYKEVNVTPETTYLFKAWNENNYCKVTLCDTEGNPLAGTDENSINNGLGYDVNKTVTIPAGVNKVRIYVENDQTVDVTTGEYYGDGTAIQKTRVVSQISFKEPDEARLGDYDEAVTLFGANANAAKIADVRTCYDYAYYVLNNFWSNTDGDITKLTGCYDTLILDYVKATIENKEYDVYEFSDKYKFVYEPGNEGGTIKNDRTAPLEDQYMFPLDDAKLGNSSDLNGWADTELGGEEYQGAGEAPHNFHYAMKAHCQFIYKENSDMVFNFRGDDDVYLFINGKLALDIGGAHTPITDYVNINEKAAELGLEDGKTYDFDFFYLERHTSMSSILIQTNLPLSEASITPKVSYSVGGVEISDGDQVPIGSKVDVKYEVTSTTKLPEAAGDKGVKVDKIEDDTWGVFIGKKDDGTPAIEISDDVDVDDAITVTVTGADGTTKKTISISKDDLNDPAKVRDFVNQMTEVQLGEGETLAVTGISVPMPSDKKLSSELSVQAEAPKARYSGGNVVYDTYAIIEDVDKVSTSAIPENNAAILIDGKLIDANGNEYPNAELLSAGDSVGVTYTLAVADGYELTDISIDDTTGENSVGFKMDKNGITIPAGWSIPNGLTITYIDVDGDEETITLTQDDINNQTREYTNFLGLLGDEWELEKGETITVSGLWTTIAAEQKIATKASAEVTAPLLYNATTDTVDDPKVVTAEDTETYVQAKAKVNIVFDQGNHGTITGADGTSVEKTDVTIDKGDKGVAAPEYNVSDDKQYKATGKWALVPDPQKVYTDEELAELPQYTAEEIAAMPFESDAKFVAVYEPVKYPYIVHYVDEDGNDIIDPVVVEDNDFDSVVTEVAKADLKDANGVNYGLKEGEEANKSITIQVTPDENGNDTNVITFVYEKNKISVLFDPKDDGEITEGKDNHSIKMGDGLSEDVPTVTPNEGYEFKGWTIKDASGEDKDKIYTDAEIAAMTFYEGTTFEAVYEKTEIPVKFLPGDNGTLTGDTDQKVKYGDTVASVPEVNPEDGYGFTGWKIEGDNSDKVYSSAEVKDLEIKEPTTFVAQYEKGKVKVTFSPGTNGQITAGDTEQTIDYGAGVDVPTDVANPGYTFKGWTIDGDDSGKIYTDAEVAEMTFTKATDFVAAYEPVAIPVKFLPGDNGTLDGDTEQNVNYGNSVASVPTVNENPGYGFTGWVIEGDNSGKVYSTPEVKAMEITEPTTFVAQYEQGKVTVTFDAGTNGKITAGDDNQTLDYGTGVKNVPTDVANEGYIFKGWTMDGDDSGKIYSDDEIAAMTFTTSTNFVAAYDPIKVNVKFEAGNNGTLTGDADQNIDYNTGVASVPTDTPNDGYKFTGWKKQGDTTDKVYTADEISALKFTEDTVFEAVYEPVEETTTPEETTTQAPTTQAPTTAATGSYTVKYVDQNGKPLADDKVVNDVTLGTSVTENALTFTGYDVDKTTATVEIKEGTNEIVFTYAPKKLNVTYKADDNGTLDGNTSETVNYGANPADVPTPKAKDGYKFTGWTKTVTAGNSSVDDPSKETITEDTVFTAVFSPIKPGYTVRYVDESGKEIFATKYGEEKTVGDTVTESAVDIAGYELVGNDKNITITIVETENGNEIVFTYKKVEEQPTETTVAPTTAAPTTTKAVEKTTKPEKTTKKEKTTTKKTETTKKPQTTTKGNNTGNGGGNYNNSTISPKTGHARALAIMFALMFVSITFAGFATSKVTRRKEK